MSNPIFLTHQVKFSHPFTSIINENEFGHTKFAYDFLFQESSGNSNIMIPDRPCFIPLQVVVNGN